MGPINLYDYTSYRQYLRDWFTWKDGRPSIRGFAKRVFVSPSLMSHILNSQRNLDPARVDTFCTALKLDPQETTYFRALVDLDQSPSELRRSEAWQIIRVAQGFHSASRVADDTFRLFSRWYNLAIAELANCEGFQGDPAWIAGRLVPAITEEEAAEALALLLELGMLQRGEDGQVTAAGATTLTGHEVHEQIIAMGLLELHRWTLQRAGEGLAAFTGDERTYGSITMAVSESQIPALKGRIKRFEEEIIHFASEQEAPERVYQLSLQLFPLSVEPDTED